MGYRSFQKSEIEKGSRILKGVEAMIRDTASMSVMIETIGSRNHQWLERKRDDFILTMDPSSGNTLNRTRSIVSGLQNAGGVQHMPHNILRQSSQTQHAISSLSSSSGSGGSSNDDLLEKRSSR